MIRGDLQRAHTVPFNTKNTTQPLAHHNLGLRYTPQLIINYRVLNICKKGKLGDIKTVY
jgi:hypothetical protein